MTKSHPGNVHISIEDASIIETNKCAISALCQRKPSGMEQYQVGVRQDLMMGHSNLSPRAHESCNKFRIPNKWTVYHRPVIQLRPGTHSINNAFANVEHAEF